MIRIEKSTMANFPTQTGFEQEDTIMTIRLFGLKVLTYRRKLNIVEQPSACNETGGKSGTVDVDFISVSRYSKVEV